MENLINSATSETNTGENWSSIIQVCENADVSQEKAQEVVALVVKRLSNKNVNVVLFSLTLSNALMGNCSANVKRYLSPNVSEMSSRQYLDCLQRLLNGKLHITVKNRILELIQTWVTDNATDPNLSYMVDVYKQLKSQGFDFPVPGNTPRSPVKRDLGKDQEEEELQLALALSLSQQEQKLAHHDKETNLPQGRSKTLFSVRAMYDFNATEEGELQLRAGDVVQVHDCTTFPDWWMGTLNGIHGIFPSNYVEKIASELDSEKDRENYLLSQMDKVLRLKQSIAKADPLGHNMAENERLSVRSL
jgi:signal transducing adaptor molecule